MSTAREAIKYGPRTAAANIKPGDVIYGTDTVTKVYRHHLHAWRVVVETTGGEYSFPETTQVPVTTPTPDCWCDWCNVTDTPCQASRARDV